MYTLSLRSYGVLACANFWQGELHHKWSTQANVIVSFEVMAEPQRDLTAEQAAKRLRNCSEVHYLLAAE
jgi:galactose-1-phosphate uridylyltransferase